MGIGVLVALIQNGVAFGTALSATYGAIGGAVLRIGGSLLLSAAANAVFGPKQPKAQDIGRELSQPTTAPAYRYIYGETRATGTPVGLPVRGASIWGCWLLNSRPSDLAAPELYLDKRLVTWTGDPFDFSGPGGMATADPFDGFVSFWISRGERTTPPSAYLTGAPWASGEDEELWKSTDGWQGRTVIWVRLRAGPSGDRQEQWPATPPLVEVEGKWSRVWDPREVGQDPDDPDTWAWSENHALCVLDALRTNPIRQYRLINLHLASFDEGADICDQTVALASGGSEPRYTATGALVFADGEIEDQVNPLFLSGAADPVRIGGQLAYAAGAWRAPAVTLDYLLGSGFEAPDMIPGDQLVNELRVSYLSPARGYETAELAPWPIPGALTADGGIPAPRTLDLPFCGSPTQAMRVRKITGLRLRRQDRLNGGELPPEALELVAASTATLSLPAPYDALDGIYEVEAIHPAFAPLGEDGGVAMRMPAQLVRHNAAIYGWVAADDEEPVIDEPWVGTRKGVPPPGAISVSVEYVDTGGTVLPRVRLSFDPSQSGGAVGYEWQFAEGGGAWQSGGLIDAEVRDGDGKVFATFFAAQGVTYDIRVRTTSTAGQSAWVEIEGVDVALAVTGGTAVATFGGVRFTGTAAPDNPNFATFRVYRGATGDFALATVLQSGIAAARSDPYDVLVGQDGTNLPVNGDFAGGATGWTPGANWSIAAGVATHTPGSTANLVQSLTGPAGGNTIRYGIDVTRAAGAVLLRLVGATSVSFPSITATGRHEGTLICPASVTQLAIVPGTTFDGSVDDITLYVEAPGALARGTGHYWIVPVTSTGVEGTPDGPYDLTIL